MKNRASHSALGEGRTPADIAVRLQYAQRHAKKTMSARGLMKVVYDHFGRALSRTKVVEILLAKGAHLRERPDRRVGGSPRVGAADRLAYAESVATKTMPLKELLELVRQRFGGRGIDAQTLRKSCAARARRPACGSIESYPIEV